MKKLRKLSLYLLLLGSLFPQELHIAHWNDFHSANLPYMVHENGKNRLVGGYAYLAGVLDSLRNNYNNLILLNAGDEFQGTAISSITKGLSQILILNKIKPDALCLGNHEFDYGVNSLLYNLSLARFDIVTTNILLNGDRKFGLPYKILEHNGVKIAIMGIIYEGLEGSTMPENVQGVKILNPVDTVNSLAETLSSKVDIIILLSHCGLNSDRRMAEKLHEVDIIIGGHSHDVLREPERVNNILICQAGCRGRYVGFLNVRVDTFSNSIKSYSYNLIEVLPSEITPNESVQSLVDSMEKEISKELDVVIGKLETPWERNRQAESNIGNWITDVLRKEFKTDIAFQNSGGIRKDLPPGPIRIRDIWEIAPFENEVVIIKLKGTQLRKLFERYPHNIRDLLQVSGARIEFDPEKEKILSVKVNGRKIKNKKQYTIATNSFVLGHINRFFGLSPEEVEIIHTNKILRDILIKAVRKEKVIKSKIEGRIIITKGQRP
ncbi:MAG: bifunctional metallophosphatase/5'-nucleotidase [Candidatus Marinimicrobia bacterium]|nr:bifunctional metallophosphatase/5'-nucleotidase [Candidatus Neomarinimicrobiota bacterium]